MYAHIIYFNYLKPDGNGMSIGGIQTYITNLIPVLIDCGYKVSVYQRSYKDFHKNFNEFDVYGIAQPQNHCPKAAEAILNKALSHIDFVNDLLIYACETCITKKVNCKSIAIQHGILWDVPSGECSKFRYFRRFVWKCRMAWQVIQRVNKVNQLVCVDYNFVNWQRAIAPYPKTRLSVIPNFSAIPSSKPQKNNPNLNIIFARRFFTHRGTRLFTQVAKMLLAKHQNIKVTIAGTGPDANYIRQELAFFDNVEYITYDSHESIKIHSSKDIAVIPTIGSEGTSLSLLEAMAAGCAVVCTNVGGMTNIVLDGYNGLMINPDKESLYDALEKLINNSILRTRLQDNAYITVRDAFSLNVWKEKWTKIIKSNNLSS